jgi:alkanesulfonate monooxygenase SsuD/methylene tetrahydromethanopterin reductase-like flavin-dependent oxidoreductase (luciferase family)
MLTPLAWRRPWKAASQVVTLDQLSNGRAVIAVGLGAKLGDFDEPQDRRTRAERLDEGIDIMRGLWENNLVFSGKHYKMDVTDREDLATVAKPVQEHIPIWCVGGWPRERSMRRILRCDGLLPQLMEGDPFGKPTPEEVRAMRTWLKDNGARDDIDIILDGETDAGSSEDMGKLGAWQEAGATWWNETRWEMPHFIPERLQQLKDRLKAGPPKL